MAENNAYILANFYAAHTVLCDRIAQALQVHVGAEMRLEEHRQQVYQFIESVEQVYFVRSTSLTHCLKYLLLLSTSMSFLPLTSTLFVKVPLPC